MKKILGSLEILGQLVVRGIYGIAKALRRFVVLGARLCNRLMIRTEHLRYRFLGLSAIILVFAGLGYAGYRAWISDLPLLWRDANIAIHAHNMRGNDFPIDIDYIQSQTYFPNFMWGSVTNSQWLWERARNIVPFFEYDGLVQQGVYPELIVFAPRTGVSSLKVGGWAWPPARQVFLNERSITGAWDEWDEGQIVSVLTHELIHIQGGNFFTSPEDVGAMGSAAWSQWIESHTVAATVEILAGMCLYGDDAACWGFWNEIENLARSSLKFRLMKVGKGGVYEWFANAFLRDPEEEASARKSSRYWADKQWEMIDILDKYGRQPWEDFVLPGVRDGALLNTGIVSCPRSIPIFGYCDILGLKFDDTSDLLGAMRWLVYLGR